MSRANPRLHLENLRPIRTHEEAVEKGRRGGLAASGARKSFARIKYCTKRCPFYDRCPVITLSLQATEGKRKKCIIKSKSREVQNYFRNLFEEGEEGIVKIVLELVFKMLIATGKEPSPDELRKTISSVLEAKKGIYGDRQKLEHSGDMPLNIIIRRASDIKEEEG